MNTETKYEHEETIGSHRVVFLVKKTGVRLVRSFNSPYQAEIFIKKLRHSNACEMVSYTRY